MAKSTPLVSCLMVTRDRVALARRALQCLAAQTWFQKELVVVDDGTQDYGPILVAFEDAFPIRYVRLQPDATRKLGALRNLALDTAQGELCIQWDDDEWYHPTRIEAQVKALEQQNLDGVVLEETLVHVDTPELAGHVYRASLPGGTPGTILHRRTAVRYPNLPRGEDDVFLMNLRREQRVGVLGSAHAHLFIRCYHGANTWEAGHFLRRLRRTPRGLFHYVKGRLGGGGITAHPAFRLGSEESAAVARFLEDSRQLALVRH